MFKTEAIAVRAASGDSRNNPLKGAAALKAIKEFLQLPSTAMPSAHWPDYSQGHSGDTPWALLRSIKKGEVDIVNINPYFKRYLDVVYLTADRPEWKKGVYIQVLDM